MTPRNPFDLLLPCPSLDQLVRENKAARKAMAKAARKLAKATHAKKLSDVRFLLGMAKVALAKAEFLARTTAKGTAGTK